MEYLYTGQIILSSKTVRSIEAAAKHLEIQSLISFCETYCHEELLESHREECDGKIQ